MYYLVLDIGLNCRSEHYYNRSCASLKLAKFLKGSF